VELAAALAMSLEPAGQSDPSADQSDPPPPPDTRDPPPAQDLVDADEGMAQLVGMGIEAAKAARALRATGANPRCLPLQ
jgi:hypothetical protein